MNRITKLLGLSAGMALAVGVVAAQAADATANIDVFSSYVFRGYEVMDNVVVQPSVNVESHGVTINAWANYDTDAPGDTDFSETDLTLNYRIPTDLIGLTVGVIEYLYTSGGPAGVDGVVPAADSDREATVALQCPKDSIPLHPVLTGYFGLEGAPKDDIYVVLALSHEISVADKTALTLGASAAWWDDDSTGESGLAEGTVSAGLGYDVTKDVTLGAKAVYSTNLDDKVLTDEAAFDDVWGGVSVACKL
jgi:hypothetical protein